MPASPLEQGLQSYQRWRQRLLRAVEELGAWLEGHRRATPRAREELGAALASLGADRLSVAFVSEPSPAATDLVHALFFSDYGRRLLPSAAGQAAPCPIEILWDTQQSDPYLRLLPVETRALDAPIGRLKLQTKHWVHFPLDLRAPERVEETLAEIRKTKCVSLAEATRLGLSSTALAAEGGLSEGVEIPKWRFAILSLPHPLLKLGLSVLDVPGLLALEAEPELTAEIVPAAQAVVFTVAADTGVTRSDLEIWQHHLKGFQSERQKTTLVALDKVETLTRGGRPDAPPSAARIAAQIRKAAQLLGIPEEGIFPVSASRALAGQTARSDAVLRQSGIAALEDRLATRMLETKHRALVQGLAAGVGPILDRNRARVAMRLARLKSQSEDMEQSRERYQDVVARLLAATRQEQGRYLNGVRQFQQSREQLLAETAPCRRILERDHIHGILDRARQSLMDSWTTVGLVRTVQGLFEDLRQEMQSIATENERIRKLVREIYRTFRDDFGLEIDPPKVFLPIRFRVEIELLFQDVESFWSSPSTILSPRGRVVRRFQEQMASRAEVLFDQLRAAFDGWIQETLSPLAEELHNHKAAMEKRLESLHRIVRAKDELQQRIGELQGHYVAFAQELTALRNIHNALHYDPLAERQSPQRPRLVSG